MTLPGAQPAFTAKGLTDALHSHAAVMGARFLRSGISIDSAEGRSLRSYVVSTPFAAPQIQSFSTPNAAASAGVLLHGLFQGQCPAAVASSCSWDSLK